MSSHPFPYLSVRDTCWRNGEGSPGARNGKTERRLRAPRPVSVVTRFPCKRLPPATCSPQRFQTTNGVRERLSSVSAGSNEVSWHELIRTAEYFNALPEVSML